MGQIRKNQAKYAYRSGKVLDNGLPIIQLGSKLHALKAAWIPYNLSLIFTINIFKLICHIYMLH